MESPNEHRKMTGWPKMLASPTIERAIVVLYIRSLFGYSNNSEGYLSHAYSQRGAL